MHYLLAFVLLVTTGAATAQPTNAPQTLSPFNLSAPNLSLITTVPDNKPIRLDSSLLDNIVVDTVWTGNKCVDDKLMLLKRDMVRRRRQADSLNLQRKSDERGEGAAPTKQATLDNKMFERLANDTSIKVRFSCYGRLMKRITDSARCRGQLDGLYLRRRENKGDVLIPIKQSTPQVGTIWLDVVNGLRRGEMVKGSGLLAANVSKG